MSRSAVWLLSVVSLFMLSGCTIHRQLTPWLRTWRHIPFRLMAESGGRGPYDTAQTERRIDGRWVAIEGSGDGAFTFADKRRAMVGRAIYGEEGKLGRIACRGVVRATPAGDELLCVQVHEGWREPTVVQLWWYDIDGQPTRHQSAMAPKQQAPDAHLMDQLSFDFLGFSPNGLMFTSFESHEGDSFANGMVKRCEAHLLHADGHWSAPGALSFCMPNLWRCHSTREWRRTQGLPVRPGRYTRDSRGIPNW